MQNIYFSALLTISALLMNAVGTQLDLLREACDARESSYRIMGGDLGEGAVVKRTQIVGCGGRGLKIHVLKEHSCPAPWLPGGAYPQHRVL